ncbi:PepSY domain-containing protein [Anaerobacillus sp. CMMVII]|uniref:PepSY domain-containing protein n=1 Tax=Anaerobacillus sp. CMMVII TaxID=2755588 RepID=UPI0021B70B0F|nr:PepSY domain-containing protein [Anaerobacillus sp. CMMVII]MCT8136611.1 PepSY domain-containing protein [Anaerobacillus sp. CMMVII]
MKLFTAVIIGAVLIGGVSVGAQVFTKDEPVPSLQEVRNLEVVSTSSTGITVSEASEIALAKVEGGVITEVEKERKNGRLVYEIEVKNEQYEYEFKIDQQTGEIIKIEKDDRDHKRKTLSPTIIPIDKAKEIALNEVAGKIDEIELERENGAYIYEVEIETDQYGDDDVTVYIDAVTGKVLYVEWDD